MTEIMKIATLHTMLNNTSIPDDLLIIYLNDCKERILNKIYPFGVPNDVVDVPPQYEMLQLKLVVNAYNKRGAEGQAGHSENGISRTYDVDNDEDLLNEIVPFAGSW